MDVLVVGVVLWTCGVWSASSKELVWCHGAIPARTSIQASEMPGQAGYDCNHQDIKRELVLYDTTRHDTRYTTSPPITNNRQSEVIIRKRKHKILIVRDYMAKLK